MSSAQHYIRQKYKTLARLVSRLENAKTKEHGWKELRTSFRRPLGEGESMDDRMKSADARESFLRVITPKERPMNQSGRWIYKDGKRVEGGEGTKRDANGKVVSSFDGKNLDPEAVTRHNQQLKRAGFMNNAHAKGFF